MLASSKSSNKSVYWCWSDLSADEAIWTKQQGPMTPAFTHSSSSSGPNPNPDWIFFFPCAACLSTIVWGEEARSGEVCGVAGRGDGQGGGPLPPRGQRVSSNTSTQGLGAVQLRCVAVTCIPVWHVVLHWQPNHQIIIVVSLLFIYYFLWV